MRCNRASRSQWPPSVTKGWPSGRWRNAAGPGQPASATASSTARWVDLAPNGAISIGSGKLPKHRHPFRFIGDHNHPRRGRGDDLLAQQRAAAALDQRQVGRDLVCAVDGQIELGRLVERRQRNAEPRPPARVSLPRSARRRYRGPRARARRATSTKCSAVEPVPSPTRMPGRTKSRARAAAARF